MGSTQGSFDTDVSGFNIECPVGLSLFQDLIPEVISYQKCLMTLVQFLTVTVVPIELKDQSTRDGLHE